MRIVIIVETGPAVGRRWLLRPGDRMVFGRTERADIVISEDPLLSSCHFRISIDGDDCQIEDLQSTNGTKLNDQRVMTRPISDGDRIIAGQSTFTVQTDSPEVCLQSTWVPEAEQQPPPESAHRADEFPAEEFDAYGTSETSLDDEPDRIPEPPSEPVPVSPLIRPSSASKSEPDRLPIQQQEPEPNSDPPPIPEPAAPTSTPEVLAATLPPQQTSPLHQGSPPSVMPPSSTPGEVPADFQVKLNRCTTGLWSGMQTSDLLSPADLAVILASGCPLRMIVDFTRTKLDIAEASDPSLAKCLMSDLGDQAASNVSPRLLNAEDVPVDQWIRSGWGADGMIILVTQVEVDPILDYFRSLMSSAGDESGRGILGVCWPSMLRSILSEGDSELANQITEPCEAILLESQQAPGGWELYGDDRMVQLLDGCRIPHTS